MISGSEEDRQLTETQGQVFHFSSAPPREDVGCREHNPARGECAPKAKSASAPASRHGVDHPHQFGQVAGAGFFHHVLAVELYAAQ